MASTKPVTPLELKTFIEAVEFAADADDWVPSPRQWKRIRDMIDRLDVATPAPAPQPQQQAPQMMMPMMPMQMGPSMMDPRMMQGGLPPPSGVPAGVPLASGAPNQSVRTPDVDTSNGQYSSPFAA